MKTNLYKLVFALLLLTVPAFATPDTFEKVDDNTLKIVTTTEKSVSMNDLEWLLADLQAGKVDMDAQYDAKIAEVQAKIDEAKNLGIVSDPTKDAGPTGRRRRRILP